MSYHSLPPADFEIDLDEIVAAYELIRKMSERLEGEEHQVLAAHMEFLEEMMDACAVDDNGDPNEDFIEHFGENWRSSAKQVFACRKIEKSLAMT